MREQFEKLPEIRKIMNENGIYFMNHSGWYEARDFKDFEYEQYINGAWYGFQEQQEKIARLQSALDELKKTCIEVLGLGISDEFERGWGRAHHRVLRRIEGIIGADK